MERFNFKLVPVPAEVFDGLGFSEGMVLEAYTENGKLIIGRADKPQELICDGDCGGCPCDGICSDEYDPEFEECDDCPYCCPECGACLHDNFPDGKDDEDE